MLFQNVINYLERPEVLFSRLNIKESYVHLTLKPFYDYVPSYVFYNNRCEEHLQL